MPITEALYGNDHPSKRKGGSGAPTRNPRHGTPLMERLPSHIRGQLARRFPKVRGL